MGALAAKFAFGLMLLLLSLSNASPVSQWYTERNTYWALGCDFIADDIGSARVPGSRCADSCENTRGCTHFAWTTFNGGTCWFKRSLTVSRASAISSRKPHAVCGVLRRSVAPRPAPAPATNLCVAKKVKIYKFCIDGSDDPGAYGEHQIRLDGHRYYPREAKHCKQSPSGFCDWREGQCHNLEYATPRSIHRAKSLTVGTEEHDSVQNDSYLAILAAGEWHNPTCETYEVHIAKPFQQEKKKSVCWEASASVKASKGIAEGEVRGSVTSCSEWIQPAESYIWFMTVEPDN